MDVLKQKLLFIYSNLFGLHNVRAEMTQSTQNFGLLPNPLAVDSFEGLVNVIGRWIYNLSIPVAVIIIIYAGVLMLISGGNPGQFKKGTEALKWAVIGLAIVLIGKGFVTLVKSILSLRNP